MYHTIFIHAKANGKQNSCQSQTQVLLQFRAPVTGDPDFKRSFKTKIMARLTWAH